MTTLFAAFGATQTLLDGLERRIPAEDVGQKIRISLAFVSTIGASQNEHVLTEFI